MCGGASLPASSPHPLPHTHPVALEKTGASFSFANDLGSGYNGPLRCFVEEKRKMELSVGGIETGVDSRPLLPCLLVSLA